MRWSCGAQGREPRRAHRRVILFFWPTRAWSPNQISMLAVSVPSRRAIAAKRAEKFMGWPALLPGSLSCLGNRRNGGRDMEIAVLGIDLGKNSCSVVGLDSGDRSLLGAHRDRDRIPQRGHRGGPTSRRSIAIRELLRVQLNSAEAVNLALSH